MCGRFALGLDQQELRLGIGDYFPRLRGGGPGGVDPGRDGGRTAARARGRNGGDRGPGDAENSGQGEGDQPGNGNNRGEGLKEGAGEAAGVDIPWEGENRFRPKNWNVAPRSTGVVLRYRRGHHPSGNSDDSGKEDKGELILETMQWGLIPHWSKHPPEGPLNTINARSENLTDPGAGGMWQSLKGHKRCVVIVEGYYEWQKKGTTKIPHFTRLAPTSSSTHPLMLLAGLYDTVTYTPTPSEPSPSPISTFTILTTTPCESLKWLHDRMPVILGGEEDVERWLDCRDGWNASVAKLLRPYEGKLECYPVQAEVGKVGTNSSSYILPVAERKDGIASFFKKQESKFAIGKTSIQSPKKEKGEEDTKDTKDLKDPRKIKEEEKVHHPAAEARTETPSVKAELKDGGLDEGIGDDSNAPQTMKVEEEDRQTGSKKRAASQTQREEDEDKKVGMKRPRTRTGNGGKTESKSENKQDEDIVIISEEDEEEDEKPLSTETVVKKTKGQATSSSPRKRAPTKTKEKGQSSIESFFK